MPLPLLLVEEDALGDALLDEYAVGIVRRVRPIDFYHESLRPVTDKFVALLLGALSPELIVSDGPSVAEFDSSHCHANLLSIFSSLHARSPRSFYSEIVSHAYWVTENFCSSSRSS